MKLAELEAKAKALAGTQHWRGLDPDAVLEALAEVECLRSELQEWKDSRKRNFDEATELHVFLAQSEIKLAKARAALEWYAGGHTGPDGESQRHTYRALCDRCQDTGERARQTLKEIGE